MADDEAGRKCEPAPSSTESKSRDAVESAIDLAKEHFSGTWEGHIAARNNRIKRWQCNYDTEVEDASDNLSACANTIQNQPAH